MEFHRAYLELEELAEELEKMKQVEHIKATELLIVTIQDHVAEVKNLTNVKVETPENTNLTRESLLEEHGLDQETIDRYAKTVQRGGYILLQE